MRAISAGRVYVKGVCGEWSSDNTAVASVSNEGLVRATGLSETTIRINGGRGSNSASMPVRVDATAGTGSWDIALADASLRQPAASVPVITVRGLLTDAGITPRRPEITTGEPALGGGTVEVELLAADGRVLYAGSAQTGRLSDGTAVPFTATLSLASAWESEVARVRVRAGRQQAEVAVARYREIDGMK